MIGGPRRGLIRRHSGSLEAGGMEGMVAEDVEEGSTTGVDEEDTIKEVMDIVEEDMEAVRR